MSDAFNRWWNAEELVEGNPYNKDTPAYWAWAGWQAGTGMKCERCGENNPAEIHTCTPMHWSDCAVHSEPAYPAGECDCGLVPVAWADKHDIEREGHDFYVNRQQPAKDGVPLYTAECTPMVRTTTPEDIAKIKSKWVGLTDDEIKDILDCGRPNLVNIKKAEQKLKEKNT